MAVEQIGFESEFADAEGKDEGFPRDVGTIDGCGEAMEEIHDGKEFAGDVKESGGGEDAYVLMACW